MADVKKATRGQIFSWTLFDFANTGFYTIIITLVFQRYFVSVIAGGNDAYWGRTISASMLITALIGPILGAVADATRLKKAILAIFTLACIAATAGLYTTGAGTLWRAIILLIIANIGFEGGTIFYDAFLPEITTEKMYAKISGYGFAMGYAGSFLSLILIQMILGENPTDIQIRSTFLAAAAFFAVFAIPMFLFVKEKRHPEHIGQKQVFRSGYMRLRETFRHIRQYKAVRRFLLAFFIYNDSILTVILFATAFASETLKMSTVDLTKFFLLVQATALAGSLLFGMLTNYIGPRLTIGITLLIWIGIVVAAFFVQTTGQFYIIGGIAGLALGSSQSTSRAFMALLTPEEKKAEFFGFFDGFFGKASAVMGPLIFGEASMMLGQRPAMLVIGGLFVVGLVLLFRVPDVRVGTMESLYIPE